MRKIEYLASLPVMSWNQDSKTYRYHLSLVDVEDFTRAIWREGEPRLAVAHTLLQRFAYLYSNQRPYETFSSFLKAYVQPINPNWFPSGGLHKKEVNRLLKAGKEKEAKEEQARAARRVEYSTTPMSSIPLSHRDLVSRILSGLTKSPVPTAQHFSESKASSSDSQEAAERKAYVWGTQRKLEVVPVAEGYKPGTNWFFAISKAHPPTISFSSLDKRSYALLVLLGLVLLARKK
jgi:hypothetical protein